jgi:hypothetical protein
MQTPRIRIETLPPPPGIIASLRTGFDTISGNIRVILLPVAFDLLLWLGPHLSIAKIMQPVLEQINSLATSNGVKADDINTYLKSYAQFFQQFNLLGVFRTFPIGVFSLMSGKMPTLSPLGTPAVIQIDSPDHLLELIFLLTFAGWMFGALYFRSVAAVVTPELLPGRRRAILQSLLYFLIWSLLSWTLGVPLLLIIYLCFAINALIGYGVLLVLGFLSMWLIVPVFFSPHGMFIKKQNAIGSIVGSFQMIRFTLPTCSLFVLTVFLIGAGLNFLWATPADDSWLALVGILGHGFITTALLAASFTYYRDINVWLQTVLGRLRAAAPIQPV